MFVSYSAVLLVVPHRRQRPPQELRVVVPVPRRGGPRFLCHLQFRFYRTMSSFLDNLFVYEGWVDPKMWESELIGNKFYIVKNESFLTVP